LRNLNFWVTLLAAKGKSKELGAVPGFPEMAGAALPEPAEKWLNRYLSTGSGQCRGIN
jgi:hypothetical protein